MVTHRGLFITASMLSLALALGACSRPTPTVDASDAAPSADSVAASSAVSDSAPPPPSSDDPQPVSQAQNGGCHQVVVGGGYQPGPNGGIITPGQTMTICDPPPIHIEPAPTPVAAASATPVAVAATPSAN